MCTSQNKGYEEQRQKRKNNIRVALCQKTARKKHLTFQQCQFLLGGKIGHFEKAKWSQMVYTGTDTFKISRYAPANQNNFGFLNARRHFLRHLFKLKQSFNLKTMCLKKTNQSFLRFHGHITYSREFSTSAVVTPARLHDSQ